MLNAFTVDVEDYYQVSAFERHIPRHRWNHYESRVVANTRRVLRVLERHQVRATFFVLGWIARCHPDLVREIHRAGHDVGSHSYWHRLVYEQTPDEFRDDLRSSRDVLEDIIGESVTAYRAPSFSITRRSLWALDILVEEGFQLDSSIVPVHHDRYGIPGAQAGLHRLAAGGRHLWEFPPAAVSLAGVTLPVGGGGYFRLYPFAWTRFCISQLHRARRPYVFYIHPWELDPAQPRLGVGSRVSRFRHHVNLASNESKLEALLSTFRFGPLADLLPPAPAMPCGTSTPALTA